MKSPVRFNHPGGNRRSQSATGHRDRETYGGGSARKQGSLRRHQSPDSNDNRRSSLEESLFKTKKSEFILMK